MQQIQAVSLYATLQLIERNSKEITDSFSKFLKRMLIPSSLNGSTLSDKDSVNRPCYCKQLFFLPLLLRLLTILVFSFAHPSTVLSIHTAPDLIEMPPKFISSKCSRTSLFWYLFSLLWQTLLKVLTKAVTYFKRCTITPWNHCHQIEKGRRYCTIFYFLSYSWEYSKAC